jgi:LPPG:FO 2-phospho-L-lactate transferase
MNVVVLVGGVGGAKLALGLSRVLPPEQVTVIVNTADDAWFYGLRVCPDIDTILYTVSGLVDQQHGWGIGGDTRHTLGALRRLGEEAWFGLGDQDFATHILRTRWLNSGQTLTHVTGRLAAGLGIGQRILPMADQTVATMVDTIEQGEIDFQTYFVKHRWQPTVRSLRFEGIEKTTISPVVVEAIEQADVILIAPSNPWLSINPILSVGGMRDLLLRRPIPRVAISPIVRGLAIKGPTAKLMQELGLVASAQRVAEHYGDVINGYVYDGTDDVMVSQGLRLTQLNTIMQSDDDKAQLARGVLEWIQDWT